jgi:hypothetical protein
MPFRSPSKRINQRRAGPNLHNRALKIKGTRYLASESSSQVLIFHVESVVKSNSFRDLFY